MGRVGVVYPEYRRLRSFHPAALRENYWQVTVEKEDGLPTARRHGWNVPGGGLRGTLLRAQYRDLFFRYVQEFGTPDVLHSHGVFWGGSAARAVSRETGIPFVHTEHSTGYTRGLFQSWEKQEIESVLTSSPAPIAVSGALARSITETVSVPRPRVVPNTVDTDYFTPPPDPRSSSSFSFLTVARLKKKKGVDLLLKAFQRAFGGRKKVRLLIGGNGPRAGALQELAATLGLTDQVVFLGGLSRSEVRERLWEANAFVLPSRVETFGVVVIEALSTGLPVVATRSGGPEEILTDMTGWVVDAEDVGQLCDGMQKAYAARDDLPSREAEIRHHAEKNYSYQAVSGMLEAVYDEVLQRSGE
jgi:glycosyltransferase involved in cell wall biosynthesis